MKIGIAIAPLLSPLQDIQEAGEAVFVNEIGIEHIEIHTNFLDDFIDEFLRLLKKAGMSYSVHCPHMYFKIPTNFCSAKPEKISESFDWLKKSIKYAKEINAKNIILHADKPEKCSQKEALDILEEHIRRALPLLGRDQLILVENMPDKSYALSTPKEFQDFLKRFKTKEKAKTGVCWDVGHSYMAVKNKNLDFPRLLKSKIKEVHVFGIRKKGKKPTDHFPIDKKSILNLKKLSQELKKIKYKGVIVMEIITENPLDIIESKKELEKFI